MRTGSSSCATDASSARWTRRRSRTTRMIRLMIGRDLKSLYVAARRAAGRRRARDRWTCAPRPIPDRAVSLDRSRAARFSALPGWSARAARELARAIFGIDPPLGGGIRLRGEPIDVALAARGDRRAASISCRRTASAPACSSTSRSPRTSRCPICAPIRASTIVLARAGDGERRARRRSGSTSAPPTSSPMSARYPAATSRRSCWRAGSRCGRASSSSTSRRAGSTSAPRTRSTSSCESSPTTASPS